MLTRIAAITFLVGSFALPSATTTPPSTTRDTFQAAETDRIHRRLTLIEQLLRAKDVSTLRDDQRRARVAALDELHAYVEARSYPRNYVNRSARVPVFVDPHGTHCAVAHLLRWSGEGALVDAIMRAHNGIYVDEARDALAPWAERNGFDVEELALIQPTYGPSPTDLAVESFDKPKLLELQRQSPDPIFTAVQRGRIDVVTFLLESGADPNVVACAQSRAVLGGNTCDDLTLLHSVVEGEQDDVGEALIRLLVKHGADPNKLNGSKTPLGRSSVVTSPLYLAVHFERARFVALLKSLGADENQPGMFGRTTSYHFGTIVGETPKRLAKRIAKREQAPHPPDLLAPPPPKRFSCSD